MSRPNLQVDLLVESFGHALDLAGAPRPADTYTLYIHSAQPERRE